MKTCKVIGCNNTELIYSGIDALVLGVVTEKFCYSCANIYAQVRAEIAQLQEAN